MIHHRITRTSVTLNVTTKDDLCGVVEQLKHLYKSVKETCYEMWPIIDT